MAKRAVSGSAPPHPWLYSLFFLWIEPVATAVGAFYAHFRQDEYLRMTYENTTLNLLGVTTAESIVLSQLANLYLVFALNEAVVLRSTNDRRVWNAFLLCLLIADFGHIYSVYPAGVEVYWRFWEWNMMYAGNLGFVYVGATFRTAFLLGAGFNKHVSVKAKK